MSTLAMSPSRVPLGEVPLHRMNVQTSGPSSKDARTDMKYKSMKVPFQLRATLKSSNSSSNSHNGTDNTIPENNNNTNTTTNNNNTNNNSLNSAESLQYAGDFNPKEHADRLKTRLKLAYFKLCTNQTHIPLTRLSSNVYQALTELPSNVSCITNVVTTDKFVRHKSILERKLSLTRTTSNLITKPVKNAGKTAVKSHSFTPGMKISKKQSFSICKPSVKSFKRSDPVTGVNTTRLPVRSTAASTLATPRSPLSRSVSNKLNLRNILNASTSPQALRTFSTNLTPQSNDRSGYSTAFTIHEDKTGQLPKPGNSDVFVTPIKRKKSVNKSNSQLYSSPTKLEGTPASMGAAKSLLQLSHLP